MEPMGIAGEAQAPGNGQGARASSRAPALYRGAGYNVQSVADPHASLLASAIKTREHHYHLVLPLRFRALVIIWFCRRLQGKVRRLVPSAHLLLPSPFLLLGRWLGQRRRLKFILGA